MPQLTSRFFPAQHDKMKSDSIAWAKAFFDVDNELLLQSVGVIELAGGLLLLSPFRKFAVLILSTIMAGAAYFHLSVKDGLVGVPAAALALLLVTFFLSGPRSEIPRRKPQDNRKQSKKTD
jgi:hypothetical protein